MDRRSVRRIRPTPAEQPVEPEDDGWEYYDDTTTLSDFWSNLMKQGDDNPLELWLEAFQTAAKNGPAGIAEYSEEATPDNVFEEYWRIMVPRLLSPTHRCNSLEQKWDTTKINQYLLDTLDAFICGTKDFQKVYQNLSANDAPPTLCGKLFQSGDPNYACKDCGQDPTCVMCDECFHSSNHKNHRYRMATSDGGGYCDCGDLEAFRQDATCEKHMHLADNQLTKDELMDFFPQDVIERTKMILTQVLKYIIEVTCTKKKFAELKVGEKDKETWPELKYTFDFSRYCLVLFNDDNHSFHDVIRVLKKCVGCTPKVANDLTEFIHNEGRAVLKVGNYSECGDLRIKIEASSKREWKGLTCDIIPTYILAHQNFAIRLLNWILELFKKSSGFRLIFCDVIFSVEDNVMLTLEGKKFCICEAILMLDAKIWKEARKVWFNVLVEGIMKDYESKKILAQLYVTQYKSIMNAFIGDDQEEDISITNLAVQIFTVPSIAENLIYDYDAFHIMASFFHEQLEDQRDLDDGKLHLEQWMEDEKSEYSRTEHTLQDMKYLVNAPPDGPISGRLRTNLVRGIEKFIDILCCLEGFDEQKREVIQHVEEESMDWEHIFKLSQPIISIVESIVEWCRKHPIRILPDITSRVSELCLKNKSYSKKKVVCKFLNVTREFNLIDFDVLSMPVSIHIPLHRLLADLVVCHNGINRTDGEENLKSKVINSLQLRGCHLELIEPVLTTLAMLATSKMGMWRRNGSPVEGQLYIYHNPSLGAYSKSKDLLMLQVAAILDDTGGDEFIMSILNRFNLLDWYNGRMEATDVGDESYENGHLLGNEFLSIVLGIIMERHQIGVGQVTPEEVLEHTLIHLLCVGSMTHSKILKSLKVEDKREAEIDEILAKISDYTSCTKEPTKKVYRLKKEYESRYNPFYYFYAQQHRDQAMSNMMTPVKPTGTVQGNQDEGVVLIVPPSLPKLTHLFEDLQKITMSLPMLQLYQSTLKRFDKSGLGLRDARMLAVAQKQLHKILFLINIGFQEDLNSKDASKRLFTEKAETMNLFQLLQDLSPPEELKSLAQYTISKAAEARATILQKVTDVHMVSAGSNSSESDEANARKRRALESRARLLADMSKKQNKFSNLHAKELKEIDSEDVRQNPKQNHDQALSRNLKCIAVGHEKSTPNWIDKLYDCSFCKEQHYVGTIDTAKNVFVLLAYTNRSSILSQSKTGENSTLQRNYLSANLSCGPVLTTCGHVMHSSCYQTFFENLATSERANAAFRQMSNYEFLCPGCQRLCNVVLPVLPPLHRLLPSVKHKRETFETWIKNTIEILSDKYTENPATGGATGGGFDIFRLRLKNEDKPSTKNPTVTQLPSAIAGMVNAFALNNFGKCLSENPSEEDSRVLQMTIQSAAIALHITQIRNSETGPVNSLVVSYSPFFDECLRSLIKICYLLPFSSTKPGDDSTAALNSYFLKCLRSNALYLLSIVLCGDQDKNFLEIDAVSFLIGLVTSYPSLMFPKSSMKMNFGENDLNVLHLCVVLHLVQIIAGYQGDDDSDDEKMETEDGARSTLWTKSDDDSSIKKLATRVAEVVGWSDVHFAKRSSPALLVKSKMLHFLRCAALFFHAYTDVPLPSGLIITGPEDAFKALMSYLGLPTSLGALLKVPGTQDLIDRLLSSECLQTRSTLMEYPLKRRELITLPESYTSLLKRAADSKCPYNVVGECKNPSLCLVCDTIVCSQSLCCESVIDRRSCGGCSVHAHKCSADIGIFLRIRDCRVLLLAELKRGTFLSAPYVDAYGETDDGLKRGNPLKLDRAMYETLKQTWSNNDISARITTSFDQESILFSPHWYSL